MTNKPDPIVTILYLVKNKWKFIIASVAISILCAYIITFFIPKKYRSDAVIIPLNAPAGAGSGLSNLASQIVGLNLPQNTQTIKLTTLFKSRALSEQTAKDHPELYKFIFNKLWDSSKNQWRNSDPAKLPTIEDAGSAILDMIFILEDTAKGTLTLTIESIDPELSYKVSSLLLEEATEFLKKQLLTDQKRNKYFIAKQLQKNQEDYLLSSKELKNFYDVFHMSSTAASIDVDIPLLSNELHLATTTSNNLPQNTIVKNVPQQVYHDYLLMRNTVLQTITSFLMQQLEQATIDEAKNDLPFIILDEGRKSFSPSKPKVKLILLATGILSFTLIFFTLLIRISYWPYYKKKLQEVPTQ